MQEDGLVHLTDDEDFNKDWPYAGLAHVVCNMGSHWLMHFRAYLVNEPATCLNCFASNVVE